MKFWIPFNREIKQLIKKDDLASLLFWTLTSFLQKNKISRLFQKKKKKSRKCLHLTITKYFRISWSGGVLWPSFLRANKNLFRQFSLITGCEYFSNFITSVLFTIMMSIHISPLMFSEMFTNISPISNCFYQ